MTADHARRTATGLAARTWGLLLLLAAASSAIAGTVVGGGAALSALVGVGLIAILFGVSVVLLRWTATRPNAAVGILLGGLGARIGAYLLVLDAVSSTSWVHGASLALATAAAFAVTLVAELVWLARTPQLFTVDTEVRRAATALPAHVATSTATRS